MVNSIIANNSAPSGPDCAGPFTSPGPNLVGTISGCALVGTAPITGDAHLGPLADNGGPTLTHALLFPSPAVNAGDNAICAAAPVSGIDQRGVVRPVGATCDLGAVEGLTGVIGGNNMAITTGSVDLAWETGNLQTGYGLLRNAPGGLTVVPLGAGATSYSDPALTSGAYCYLLAAIDASGLLGTSDLECAVTGLAQGSVPAAFTLSLNQSATATMTWTASGSMSLVRVPLDGSAVTTTFLGSTASTIQPLGPAGDCFVVVRAASFGVSNALCGVPGFSSLGGANLAGEAIDAFSKLESVGHRLAALSADLPPLANE